MYPFDTKEYQRVTLWYWRDQAKSLCLKSMVAHTFKVGLVWFRELYFGYPFFVFSFQRKGRFAQLLENNSDCCTFCGGEGARFSAVCTRAVNMLNSKMRKIPWGLWVPLSNQNDFTWVISTLENKINLPWNLTFTNFRASQRVILSLVEDNFRTHLRGLCDTDDPLGR